MNFFENFKFVDISENILEFFKTTMQTLETYGINFSYILLYDKASSFLAINLYYFSIHLIKRIESPEHFMKVKLKSKPNYL